MAFRPITQPFHETDSGWRRYLGLVAPTAGTVAGAAIGSYLAPGAGTAIGASLGGAAGHLAASVVNPHGKDAQHHAGLAESGALSAAKAYSEYGEQEALLAKLQEQRASQRQQFMQPTAVPLANVPEYQPQQPQQQSTQFGSKYGLFNPYKPFGDKPFGGL